MGELEIPNTAKLRMGIIISKTTENSCKAVLNIIDQATGDISCDEVIHTNDSVIIRINGLGIEVAGIFDSEHKSFMSEFRQHGGTFPVLFNRVDKLPELARPQEPNTPYPYFEENVVIDQIMNQLKLQGKKDEDIELERNLRIQF
jgi:hypothetical protein